MPATPKLIFQRFADPGLANELKDKLDSFGITASVVKDAPLLDEVWFGASSQQDYYVKIAAGDFVKAHSLLEDYYKKEIESVDASYYLFEFSNTELEDIINNPGEWGPLDYQLAKKLLKERGMAIPESKNSILSAENIEQLSKYADGRSLIRIALVFIGYVLISLIAMNITYRYNFPYSSMLILLAGSHLAWGRRTLPDGSQKYLFNEADQKTGKLIFRAGVFLVLVIFIMIMLFINGFSFDPFEFSFGRGY
jgi:hypothetical protein